VCYSVLHCVVLFCSVVQCVAVWYNDAWIETTNDSGVLQCVVLWCIVLQCGTMWCNVVQYVALCGTTMRGLRQHMVAVCCSVLYCVACVAVCCSVLQCVAVWYNDAWFETNDFKAFYGGCTCVYIYMFICMCVYLYGGFTCIYMYIYGGCIYVCI